MVGPQPDSRNRESLIAEFKKFDTDDNGVITLSELEGLLETMGLDVHGDALRIMYDSIDLDGDGAIEFSEFIEMFMPLDILDDDDEDND